MNLNHNSIYSVNVARAKPRFEPKIVKCLPHKSLLKFQMGNNKSNSRNFFLPRFVFSRSLTTFSFNFTNIHKNGIYSPRINLHFVDINIKWKSISCGAFICRKRSEKVSPFVRSFSQPDKNLKSVVTIPRELALKSFLWIFRRTKIPPRKCFAAIISLSGVYTTL